MNGVYRTTQVLTNVGYVPIYQLHEHKNSLEFWDGTDFVPGKVVKSSKKYPFIRVQVNNGLFLYCIESHGWSLPYNNLIMASDLYPNSVLNEPEYPFIENFEYDDNIYMYENGLNFYSQFKAPINCATVLNRLEWYQGVSDSVSLHVRENKMPNRNFSYFYAQLVLSTLGLRSSIRYMLSPKEELTYDILKMSINSDDYKKFQERGYQLNNVTNNPNSFMKPWKIESIKEIESEYFSYSIRNENDDNIPAVYNGILTG